MVVYKLESVGSGIDRLGWTYAGLVDGGYDMDSRVHLDDIEPDGDWFEGLSDKDRSVVEAIAKNRRDDRMDLYTIDFDHDLGVRDLTDPFTGELV